VAGVSGIGAAVAERTTPDVPRLPGAGIDPWSQAPQALRMCGPQGLGSGA